MMHMFKFLQDILLQYMTCSQTVPTENRIETKKEEIHFSVLFPL